MGGINAIVYAARYPDRVSKLVIGDIGPEFADAGIEQIEDMRILKVQPINKFGTPVEIMIFFGGRDKYLVAIKELKSQIYAPA